MRERVEGWMSVSTEVGVRSRRSKWVEDLFGTGIARSWVTREDSSDGVNSKCV